MECGSEDGGMGVEGYKCMGLYRVYGDTGVWGYKYMTYLWQGFIQRGDPDIFPTRKFYNYMYAKHQYICVYVYMNTVSLFTSREPLPIKTHHNKTKGKQSNTSI